MENFMDSNDYKSLIRTTKLKLLKYKPQKEDAYDCTKSACYASLLEDCLDSVFQSLSLIQSSLDINEKSQVEIYLENIVSLLTLLENFFKIFIENLMISNKTLEDFPTLTGRIILKVFEHCKESQSLYKGQFCNYEKQVKDLFKSCHELQLFYLMILEKHFVFNLSQEEDLYCLMEALCLNLKIGGVVVDLNLTTMAEQWKTFIELCKKYSNHIVLDKDIYKDSVGCLCSLILDHINNSMKVNQDQKAIVRNFTVAKFFIKILTKTCQTFKHSTMKNYNELIHLLSYIKTYSKLNHEKLKETPQFINLLETNVMVVIDSLMNELLQDKVFYNFIYEFDVINIKNNDTFLGHIILIISIMKSVIERKGDPDITKTYTMEKLICKVFNILPYCHKWFNLDLKFDNGLQKTYGLYEHLLSHSVALTALFNTEQYATVELNLYEATLGTDCYSALFASDLWVVLDKLGNSKLRFDHLKLLCETYIKLESNKLFSTSPQRVHLANTIQRIFNIMSTEEKNRFIDEKILFDIEKYAHLLSILQVRNFPKEHCTKYEGILLRQLKMELNKLFSTDNYSGEDMDHLITTLNATGTCPLTDLDKSLKEDILKAWLMLCKVNIRIEDSGTMWYIQYVSALTALYESMVKAGCVSDADSIKVLHIVANFESISAQIKMIFTNLLSTLSKDESCQHLYQNMFDILNKFVTDEDEIVRNYTHIVLRSLSCMKLYTTEIVNENDNLDDMTAAVIFTHKCFKKEENEVNSCVSKEAIEKMKCGPENFEFADINSLFSNESDNEGPASKKAKLETNETEKVVHNLEINTDLLYNLKENLCTEEYRSRINCICDKLRNIVS